MCLLALDLGTTGAQDQGSAAGTGFQLNRHEPTPAGEWSFVVDHPWYSRTRDLAGGFRHKVPTRQAR